MENLFIFFEVFISILLLILLSRWNTSKSSTKQSLPSGPWKLPLVGNLHQFVGDVPFRRLRDLANKYGPVMHIQLGQVSTLVISSPEAAKLVMKTHDTIFAQRPFSLAGDIIAYNSRDMAFAPYGDYWRLIRKVCSLKLFSAKRVQTFRSIREEEVQHVITSISSSAGLPMNISSIATAISSCIIARAAFGSKQDETITPLVQQVTRALASSTCGIADFFPSNKLVHLMSGVRTKLQKLHEEIDNIMENVINEHRASKVTKKFDSSEDAKDLVYALLDLQDPATNEIPLTTKEIKAVVLDMFVAGTDSSATVIEWTMSEMLKNPRVLEKAQAEVRQVFNGKEEIQEKNLHLLKYLNLVVKETLRLHPPGPLLLPREAREKVEMMGYEVAEKTQIIVNAWAIGRDPNYWTEPERFNPERFLDNSIEYKGTDFQFIPFGAGRRICPGIEFGLAIVELLLANLLFHFDWELPNGMKPENLDMIEAASDRRENDLYLVPILYNPLRN